MAVYAHLKSSHLLLHRILEGLLDLPLEEDLDLWTLQDRTWSPLEGSGGLPGIPQDPSGDRIA